jgi:MarR family transcriptional regulator, organic hydroperoxide resistance regulator
MNKQDLITKIIETQHQLSRDLVPHAIESWRKLDVPLAQLKSLFIIATNDHTNFRNLAQDLGVTPGNVTGVVDRLVEQGLVVRNPNPEDRRIIRLQATEKGRALLANLMETHVRHLVQVLEGMSEEDLRAFLQGLSAFIKSIEEYKRA